MNVRFEYLYRDSGNFKNWGEVVFSNPRGVPANIVGAMAEQVLIDRTFFSAAKADVPDLHFADHNEDLDHGWHETHAFLPTDEPSNDVRNRNIEEFVESLRCASIV
ncbi:MAG: hypothetical protein HYU73_05710 [Betaproteobacteria bacterium]|nr:hypothetical protein [Betaproteobacteria bacterium]MBI3054220.1 hypothetical protein [Betaproteobacteria bacterium]